MATIAEAFGVALNHHRAGELQQAERIYRQILDVAPDHADALHYLGVLASQTGNPQAAVELIERAIGIRPRYAVYHYHLGKTLRELGKLDQAVTALQRALQIEPGFAEAHSNLGNALCQQGKLDQAVACHQRALQINPGNSDAHNNLGNALREQRKFDQAVACYQQALQIEPEFAEAHNNLGIALQQQGKLDQAVASYRRALQINPHDAGAHNNLGIFFKDQGQLDEAITCYQRALQIDPRHSDVHTNLGNALHAQRKFDQAAACYQRAMQLDPENADIHYNLGAALQELGKLDQAVAAYQQALRIKPSFAEARSTLMHQLQHVCSWEPLGELPQQVIEAVETDVDQCPAHAVHPFLLLASPTPTTAAQQLQCARRWVAARLRPTLDRTQGSATRRERHEVSRITVGYVSADFRAHPVSWLTAELFERHDREHFEVVGYSYGPDDHSPTRQRIVKAFDRFRDMERDSYVEAAERIAADGVDILVDLSGHTRYCRPQILAQRPAPIQVNYLGYAGTMGGDFMDYILVDDFVVPPDQQPHFTERLVHLPGCYLVNSKREISSETPSRSACGLPEEGFVFCSFNNSYKISPQIFDVWMRLLRAVPHSVLWLRDWNRFVPANLCREAEARGVSSERLVFASRAPMPEHLARHRVADLFLDTFPFNAHTTASDAMWTGLPLVTLAGETFVSRVAASVLRAVGLPQLITHSLEQYESLALQLATDADRLAEIRSCLADKPQTCDFFRTEVFCRHVEEAYRKMWQLYQAGEKPR